MQPRLATTSWRGLRIEHPDDWEVALMSGLDEPGHLILADRRWRRLDIHWRAIPAPTNLDLLMEKHRRREKDADVKIDDLTTAPPEWKGLTRHTPEGAITHAGRFFRSTRWLVEVVVIWPKKRDVALENEILRSVSATDPNEPTRLWQALGLSLTLGKQFELVRSAAPTGRVTWEFTDAAKPPTELMVERLAMPHQWLKEALRDWLEIQVPSERKILRRGPTTMNRHQAEEVISVGRTSLASRLGGLRNYRRDVAWLCPTESRLYRASAARLVKYDDVPLPESLAVRCCGQVAPSVGDGQ